jgi:sugar diacid utilization regulator
LTNDGRMRRRFTAIFLLGAILGAVTTSTWQAKEMESLYLQVRKLTLHNDDLAEENTRLSMEMQQPQKTVLIKGVQVDCISSGNDWAVYLAAANRVKEELSFLVGKDLDVLIRNPDLPARVLNGQTFSVDSKRYRLKVALVVISETLFVQVQAGALN